MRCKGTRIVLEKGSFSENKMLDGCPLYTGCRVFLAGYSSGLRVVQKQLRRVIKNQAYRFHIFPKQFLKSNKKSRGDYNQIANYVLMQQEINIAMGARPPGVYFNELREQCNDGQMKYGSIATVSGQVCIDLSRGCSSGCCDPI